MCHCKEFKKNALLEKLGWVGVMAPDELCMGDGFCLGHRIIDWFGWEGTCEDHLFHPPAVSRDISSQTRVLRAPSNLAWNVPRDGVSTTPLGNPCQGSTTLKFLPCIQSGSPFLLFPGAGRGVSPRSNAPCSPAKKNHLRAAGERKAPSSGHYLVYYLVLFNI